MNKRIESEQLAIVRITNNHLVCKDCLLRLNDAIIFGNTSRCENFPKCKPKKVLLGGKCNCYIKE